MSFFDLPVAGTGDLRTGALLVLQDRRVVEILDVVRDSSIDAVERSFATGLPQHSPLLGPIQHLGVLNHRDGKHECIDARELSGARLLRDAPPRYAETDAA